MLDASDAKYTYIYLCGTRMEHHIHFFLYYPQNHSVRLGFGPIDKHVADIAQKHAADIAQKREVLLYLT